MNTEPLDKFEEGNNSQREKLNAIVERVNELTKELAKVLAWATQTVVVHDAANENLIRVTIKGIQITGNLGEIDCDCVSNGESGDA